MDMCLVTRDCSEVEASRSEIGEDLCEFRMVLILWLGPSIIMYRMYYRDFIILLETSIPAGSPCDAEGHTDGSTAAETRNNFSNNAVCSVQE